MRGTTAGANGTNRRGSVHEEDSLAEAIANELARTAGFVHVTDDLLVASVNVDVTEERTFLVSEEAGDRSVFLSRDDDIEN